MRTIMMLAVVAPLFLGAMGQAQSGAEARTIIGKAIKAMGHDQQPKNVQGFQIKSKGTLDILGMNLNFTQSITIRLPNQFKDAMDLEVNNMTIPVVTIFDGQKGWVEANGKVVKLDDKLNQEFKEIGALVSVARLTVLLDKKYELDVTGEVNVEGKPALGVRVATKGAKDINLFFDKKTHFLTKVERQALDPMTFQEVQEERIIRSYKEKDGRHVPHKVLVNRDGKKLLEAEILEITPLETVDQGEFAMPK